MKDVKLCKDCKWCCQGIRWTCRSEKRPVSLLTGAYKEQYCEDQRSIHEADDSCGPEGKWWEPCK